MTDHDTLNELVRIYCQRQSKRTNLPTGFATPEQANEIDSLIGRAAKARHDNLEEFKFQHSDVMRPPFGGRTGGTPHIDLTSYCERIDSFLAYLRGTLPADTVERIGFRQCGLAPP